MAKRIFRIILKIFIVILILIAASIVFLVSNWQVRYKYNHDYVTIMGDEYYFDISFILHSEKEFRSVSAGTTYEELVKRFGRPNGVLNPNGFMGNIYYALAEDRFIVVNMDPLCSYENGEKNWTWIAWRMHLCDDKEKLEVLFEDKELYEDIRQKWEEDVLKPQKE